MPFIFTHVVQFDSPGPMDNAGTAKDIIELMPLTPRFGIYFQDGERQHKIEADRRAFFAAEPSGTMRWEDHPLAQHDDSAIICVEVEHGRIERVYAPVFNGHFTTHKKRLAELFPLLASPTMEMLQKAGVK